LVTEFKDCWPEVRYDQWKKEVIFVGSEERLWAFLKCGQRAMIERVERNGGFLQKILRRIKNANRD